MQNYFEIHHKCTSYGPDKLNIGPVWPLFDHCDLDLQHTWKNISNSTSPPWGQQLCKIVLKSMHKCTSNGLDKLHIGPFWPLFNPCDLDLQPTWKNVSNGLSPSQGQQLCKIIFEIHAEMYMLWTGQAQYMTIFTFIWPLWPLPSTYLKNVSNSTSPPWGQQLCQLIFEIHA